MCGSRQHYNISWGLLFSADYNQGRMSDHANLQNELMVQKKEKKEEVRLPQKFISTNY